MRGEAATSSRSACVTSDGDSSWGQCPTGSSTTRADEMVNRNAPVRPREVANGVTPLEGPCRRAVHEEEDVIDPFVDVCMKTPGRTSRNRLWNGHADRSTHSGIVGPSICSRQEKATFQRAQRALALGFWLKWLRSSNVQAVAAVPRQTLLLGSRRDHCRLERRSDERM